MSEIVKNILDQTKDQMEKAISHLEAELSKIRTGKASPQMLDAVFVDYYGTSTPLSQVANVNTPDARTIVVQPWEKALLATIEKAIFAANLGLNPQNDGAIIRIAVPPLTEERRKEMVKKAKGEGENCKVTVRNLRRDANEAIRKSVKDNGVTEDLAKDTEGKVQTLTDTYIIKVDKHLEIKEREMMTV